MTFWGFSKIARHFLFWKNERLCDWNVMATHARHKLGRALTICCYNSETLQQQQQHADVGVCVKTLVAPLHT